MQFSRKSSISIDLPADQAFELFTPLGELKWVKNWDPQFVWPEDGKLVKGLTFKTAATNDSESEYIWVVTMLNELMVEYTVFTQNRTWNISVLCAEAGTGTRALICYTFTALNLKGIELNRLALQGLFEHDLRDWEEAIRQYLSE